MVYKQTAYDYLLSWLLHHLQPQPQHTRHVGQTKMREVFAWQQKGVRVEMQSSLKQLIATDYVQIFV